MKKYFLSIVALASMLFATSCQESLVEPQVGGPTTFTVQVPDAMGTKAIGDKENVNQLLVAVYSEATGDNVALTRATATSTSGQFKVQFNLLQDQSYDIVFWAQVENEYVNATANDFDLKSITMKNDNHNNEEGAAFFAYVADFVPTGSAQSVTLKRPFAQLNLGTTGESLNPATGEVFLVSSEIKIKGLAQRFNTITGMGENPTTEVVTYSALIPTGWQKLSAASSTYEYVSMDYLPIVGDAKAVFDIEANITVAADVNNPSTYKTINHKFTSVPVQENYRTNIVGNLISSSTDFNVVVDDRFVDENGNLNPDYIVVDDVAAAVTAYTKGETHVAINYIVNGGKIVIPDNAKEALYLQLPDVNATFTVEVPSVNVKKLNITVPNTYESNIGLNLIIDAPNSTVEFTGQAAMINSTTAPNTLNLNGAEVGTIIVKQGNVVIENQSQVEVLDNQSGGQVTVYVDNTSDVNVPQDGTFVEIEEPAIIDTYEALRNALTYSNDVVLGADFVLDETLVIQRRDFIFDGNGKTLTSTAGRAINVSGVDGVTIKNLNINCTGERAINIIQNATNVTIDNVTATAANYTVNVAGSAPKAIVNITNSTLNGLCTVNVSGEEAEVYVNNSTVNCNDNNTTAGESYAALSLNKDAEKGKIIATNTVVTVTPDSDSYKGRNGAEDGVVKINDSTEDVVVMVAAITYQGSDYYYAFESLDGAIDFAQDQTGVVTLIRSITVEESIVIEEGQTVVLDLNGKTIAGTMHKSVGAVVENNGTLTIQKGIISSTANNGGSAIKNNGTLTVEDATLNGAPNADGSWPAYTVNNTSKMTATNTKFTSYHGSVASYGEGAKVILNDSEIDMAGIAGFTNHGIYTYNDGMVVVNGGTYANKAEDQASTGASVINGAVVVNAGTFTGRIENYSGTPVLKGGTYSVKPNNNFIAAGYEAIKKGDKYYVVKNDVAVVTTADELVAALEDKKDVLFANDIKIEPAKMSNAYGTTGINVKNGQTIDGNGYTLNIKGAGGTWDSGINTTGGTIKNITVTGSFRGIFINHNSDYSEKVVLENVTIGGNGTVYTISCDQGLYQGIEATNCTFNGWTSFAETAGEAKFVNCNFGEGSGYKYCRPYSNTEFVNCTFCPGYAVDRSQAEVTFTNCTWEE